MWDALQEEICGVIEKAGIKLNKEEHNQLYKAILLLVGGAINEEALLIKIIFRISKTVMRLLKTSD